MNMRTRIVLILVVVIGAGGLLGIGALMLKADQDAAVAQFGEAVVSICKTAVDSSVTGRVPENAKLVIIDTNTATIAGAYQPKLSAVYAATGKDDVTHVACVKTVESVYNVTEYGKTGKYKCRQYQRDLEVGIFEVKTGLQIAFGQVKGNTPPTCPDKTDKSLSKYGAPPEAGALFQVIGVN